MNFGSWLPPNVFTTLVRFVLTLAMITSIDRLWVCIRTPVSFIRNTIRIVSKTIWRYCGLRLLDQFHFPADRIQPIGQSGFHLGDNRVPHLNLPTHISLVTVMLHQVGSRVIWRINFVFNFFFFFYSIQRCSKCQRLPHVLRRKDYIEPSLSWSIRKRSTANFTGSHLCAKFWFTSRCLQWWWWCAACHQRTWHMDVDRIIEFPSFERQLWTWTSRSRIHTNHEPFWLDRQNYGISISALKMFLMSRNMIWIISLILLVLET